MNIGDRIPLDEKLEELFDEARTANVVFNQTVVLAQERFHMAHRNCWDYIYSTYPELRKFSVALDQNARELILVGPAAPNSP